MREEAGRRPLMGDVLASLRLVACKAEKRLREKSGTQPGAVFAELAVEFDCRMSPRWNERRQSADTLLHMGRASFPWLDRRPVRHVRIVCRREDDWEPIVCVDGTPETSAVQTAGLLTSNKEGDKK